MIAWLGKWWARIAASVVALTALWFGLRAGQHRKKRDVLSDDARRLEKERGQDVADAQIARSEVEAAALEMHAAELRGRARIRRIEERTDEDFARRVDRINQRLRGD